MTPLVFVAVSPGAARRFRDTGAQADGIAYAATAALRESFGYGADADEEADYAAQVFASLAGLLAGWDRCVLVVAVRALPPSCGASDYGQVEPPVMQWTDVRAVFVDEPAALPAVRAYAEGVGGRGIAELWADPAAAQFVADHDLLWFGPHELDQTLADLCGHPITKGD